MLTGALILVIAAEVSYRTGPRRRAPDRGDDDAEA
jgi:hypothetical protein